MTGLVRNFPIADQLFAVARPQSAPNSAVWAVSKRVFPGPGGEWEALIDAQGKPGEKWAAVPVRIEQPQSGEVVNVPGELAEDGPASPLVTDPLRLIIGTVARR